MRLSIIRKIDYYLGPLICRCLLLVRSFFKPRLAVDDFPVMEDCGNILIIKFFGMGSILLASPAFSELKKHYPSARITILTLESNQELCRLLPSIDHTVGLYLDSASGFIISFLKILGVVGKLSPDIVIDLEFLTNFSAMMTLLVSLICKPRVIVGFNAPLKWRNITHDVNVSFDHSRHITRIFAKVVRSLGGGTMTYSFEPERVALRDNCDPNFFRTCMDENQMVAGCRHVVCVNINAGDLCLHRRWPRDSFAVVVNELLKRPDVAVFLIGGKKDRAYVSRFRDSLDSSSRIVDVCGRTSIRQLIGLFSHCDFLLTNDSGPMHLAEIVGLPTIAFFGPETPLLYGPVDEIHHVFYDDLYCSPCLNIYNSKMSHCTNNMCLKRIDPQQVLEVVRDRFLPVEK